MCAKGNWLKGKLTQRETDSRSSRTLIFTCLDQNEPPTLSFGSNKLNISWLCAACLYSWIQRCLSLDTYITAGVTQTSVGEPRSAEGLQVLVSGSAVPALLRTGEDGVAPAGASGMLEACRKMPCRWRRAHVLLQLKRSRDNNWTCTVTVWEAKDKNSFVLDYSEEKFIYKVLDCSRANRTTVPNAHLIRYMNPTVLGP